MAAEKYLLGEMTGPELDEFEEHMFECDKCAEAVKNGVSFTENARAVFHEYPNLSAFPAAGQNRGPEKASHRRRAAKPAFWKWFSFPQIATSFAALGLLCLVGYQQVEINRLHAPHATAVFLAFATRGAGAGVLIPKSAGPFTIEIDSLSTKCLSGCTARVLDSQGNTGPYMNLILTPERNTFISLNRASLSTGDYSVVVQTAAQAKGTAVEDVEKYPFHVE